MSARVPEPEAGREDPFALNVEHLASDIADELLRAAQVELLSIEQAFGVATRAKFARALKLLAKLSAKKVAGEQVDEALVRVQIALRRYAAIASIVITRAAERLTDEGWKIAGQWAERAGGVLGQFALGLALGAAKG